MTTTPDFKIFIGLLILIAWLPLPFASNHAWAWAIMEVSIFTLTFLWLWQFLQGRVTLTPVFSKAKPILIVLTLWLIYVGLQCLPLPHQWIALLSPKAAYLHDVMIAPEIYLTTAKISVDSHLTAVAWLKSLSYVLLFMLTLLLVNGYHRLRWLAYTLVFSGVFQAIYGSLMVLSKWEYSFFLHKVVGTGIATGTFVNRNHLAGYLELCIAVGIGLLISQLGDTTEKITWRQRLRSLFDWILSGKMRLRLYLAMMVIALVLTHSRMGNTAFFSSLIIAGIIGLILSRHATRATVILLTSLILIDLLIVGAWFGIDKVKQRLEETTLTTETRDEVDTYTMLYWQDYWLTGSGLGSFYTVFPHYRGADIEGYFDHAHNDYLELAAETGVIGLILMGSSILLSLGAALTTQYRRHNSLCRGMAFSAIMGITALLIHSSVDFNLQIPANAATFMIILALAWIARFLPRKHSSPPHPSAIS